MKAEIGRARILLIACAAVHFALETDLCHAQDAPHRSVPLHFDHSKVMMARPEVDLIVSYLAESINASGTSDAVYLEYGSGGSTVAFTRFVKQAFSIEHNCAFARMMKETLAEEGLGDRVDMRCAAVPPGTGGWGRIHGFEHGSYRQFQNYVDAVDQLGVAAFDFVLVDGRARLACALKVLPYLKDRSIVFLHDFYGDRVQLYGGVLKYYDEVARVLARANTMPTMGPVHEPQGLLVLRRKQNIEHLLPLSAEQIHAEYDAINWHGNDPKAPDTALESVLFVLGGYLDIRNWKLLRNRKMLLSTIRHDTQIVVFAFVCAVFVVRLVRPVFAGLGSRARADKQR
ncbi:hypothetical protein FVE85_2891 [Porphyridium purpureum]|uniref:Uncharacterized protein n=1 Tax=Porphyridium purpureum TaxID=35688 RepID=A0A5J4YUN1_PORPP|nr:hypothetical protein FVE85_2891 [Porphyridium purpureum]|eukprot:POR9873..scf227_4